MNDRRQIFRQAALDRPASPDQVDRPLRVVGGAGWLALSVFLLGLTGFLAWVTTTTAPVKVKGRGIMIASSGLNQIVANTQGRLKTLAIRPGDHIAAGDIAATFEQTELGRELETVRAGLVDSRYRYAKLTDFYRENNRREEIFEAERIDTIKQTRNLLQERLALLRKKQNSVSRLLKKKVITEDDLIEVQLQLSEARERLAKLDDEEKAIASRKQERLSKQGLTLIALAIM